MTDRRPMSIPVMPRRAGIVPYTRPPRTGACASSHQYAKTAGPQSFLEPGPTSGWVPVAACLRLEIFRAADQKLLDTYPFRLYHDLNTRFKKKRGYRAEGTHTWSRAKTILPGVSRRQSRDWRPAT